MKRANLGQQANTDLLEAARHCACDGGVELAECRFDAAIAAFEPIERMPGMGSSRLVQRCKIPGLRSRRVTGLPMQCLYLEAKAHLDVVRLLGDRQDIIAIPMAGE